MRIVFIGSGNIAHFFATRLAAAGHDLCQVYSPDIRHAAILASRCSIPAYTDQLAAIVPDADAYILAVKDDALPQVAAQLSFPGKVVLHCAGAVPVEVLAGISEHRGVIWSLYSVKKEHLPETDAVPLVVEAGTGTALETALILANAISATVLQTDFRQRQWLHLNAVLVNNFTNHLLAIAQRLCEANQLPFAILHPIISQTLAQVQQRAPSDSQTGPALRHDNETIAKHLELLAVNPLWQQLYAGMTASIQQMASVPAS